MTIEELVKQAVKEVVAEQIAASAASTTDVESDHWDEDEVEVAEAPVEQLQSNAKSGS